MNVNANVEAATVAGVGRGCRTSGMPPKPRKRAMTGREFKSLLDASGMDTKQAAEILGVGRTTVYRWLNGTTPITAANAMLVKDRIRPNSQTKKR